MYASVVLDIPTQSLDAAFTYAIPAGMDAETLVGRAVVVPFGHRRALGFVLAVLDDQAPELDGLDPAKIKELGEIASEPFFDENGAACAQFLAHTYVAPLSSCVRLFTPPGGVPKMVQRGRTWTLQQPAVGQVDDRWATLGPCAQDYEPRKGSYKQQAVLDALRQGDVRVAELNEEFGSVASTLKALEKKGVVVVEHRRRMRGMVAGEGHEREDGYHYSVFRVDYDLPVLTPEQEHAVNTITAACARKQGEVVLLDGVTGSGKTEVYLRVIEQVLAAHETAIVLVPEISLTPQTVARFRGRFGDAVAVMHSRMSQGERFDQWDFIRSGRARVVVGARSALFTPMPRVGVIIIDEEHEGSYKQDSAPRYHARDVACWMARRTGCAVVLGSATPSIEALYACKTADGWHHVEMKQRANGKPMPTIRAVDMAREFAAGHRSMFSRPLIKALREELSAGHKAVLLLNQRGFAKFLLCRDCGYVPTCESCSTSLTFHEQGNMLVCHHCGYHQAAPATCPECDSPYLKRFGAGTQRVEADLRALIESFGEDALDTQVVRMDADTTKGKGAHQRLLEEFAKAPRAVLLGTQMIAKGLDFEDVTLVGVINADTMLHLPDYRAAERTFDLVEQVAGRAGRAELSGQVIVQTYDASVAAIRAAQTYDRALFLADELPKRELLGYPPYVRMANILVWGEDEQATRQYAETLHNELAQVLSCHSEQEYVLHPATPCVLGRLKGKYRWHILLTCARELDPGALLEPFFRARKTCEKVHISIDVDPQNLL